MKKLISLICTIFFVFCLGCSDDDSDDDGSYTIEATFNLITGSGKQWSITSPGGIEKYSGEFPNTINASLISNNDGNECISLLPLSGSVAIKVKREYINERVYHHDYLIYDGEDRQLFGAYFLFTMGHPDDEWVKIMLWATDQTLGCGNTSSSEERDVVIFEGPVEYQRQ